MIGEVRTMDEGLCNLAKKFKNLVLLHSDFSDELGVNSFMNQFAERSFQFGLAEQTMVSASAGFAVTGKLPVVVGLANFICGRAFEQVKNTVCSQNLNVKFFAVEGGHEADEDIALMRSLPNMKVVCPADHNELIGVMEALSRDYGPTYVRVPAGISQDLSDGDFEFGKSKVVREGSDSCIFASGEMVAKAIERAQEMEKEGDSVMVVNVSSIKPIDVNTIVECAQKVEKCFYIEKPEVTGGLGSAVSEVLAKYHPVKLKRLMLEAF